MADRVHGKVALVTGGALGIGEACCKVFAREGAKVAVTDVKEKEGEAVANAIRDAGGDAVFMKHDVASEEDWERAVDAAVAKWGRLDVLVNNAGIGATTNAEDDTLEKWRRLMSVNLDGVFLGTKYAIRAMKKSGGGAIINISSVLGLVGDGGAASYCASKGGIRLLTKSAALYCAKAGYHIRVNSVHPGYVWTPMVRTAAEATGDAAVTRKYLESLHPLGRLGEVEDVAYGVLYLASDEAAFVTGAELVIDGGYTAQ
jgi:NAD(P)-dependent dehydrogenase (short-subunit alcohol dehydrogenase family)